MTARTLACTALFALAALTAGCDSGSGTDADPAACKTAMAKQLQEGMADAAKNSASPTPSSSRPAACIGIDDKTAQRLAGEVTKEWLASDEADKAVEDAIGSVTPVPVPTGPQISAECRAWIERELQDSSEDIDATTGYDACGDLSEEELDQAIEAVTQDLIDATP